jgi:hypothetical protein
MGNVADLDRQLDRWTAAGLLTDEQAARIRVHEADVQRPGVARWVEPVGYLGATLVALSFGLFGAQLWDELSIWSRVALAATVTVVLLVAGGALLAAPAPPAKRAGSFAWALAVAGVAYTSQLTGYEVIDDDDIVLRLTATTSVVTALILYLLAKLALQHLALAVAAVVFALFMVPTEGPVGGAVAVYALGVLWGLLTWAGRLRPAELGWIVAPCLLI